MKPNRTRPHPGRHGGSPAGRAVLLLALACAPAGVWSQRAPDPAAASSRPALAVTVATAQQLDWPRELSAAGSVQPWHEAVVNARSSGLALTEVLADRGSRVRRGQVLARFDDRALQAERAQAEASVAQAEASARQALVNRERTLSLRNSGAVSEQDELQAVTAAATAVAQLQQARAALEAARVRLDHAVVTAPDHGTLSSRSATLGQVSNAGAELFRLVRQDRLEWRAELPAQQLAAVQPGQVAEVTLPDGRTSTGRVRSIAPGLDATTRLAQVTVDLPAGSGARPAMYLQGRLRVGQAAALVVPADSVVLRDGRPYVFVLQGERVGRVAVDTGRRQGAQVEVTRGLQPGQRVVVRGAGFLADGDAVQVAPHSSSATGPVRRPLT